MPLHFVEGADAIHRGGSLVARQFFQLAPEVRAHRCFDFLDGRPAPARERLRLAYYREDAGHVRRRGDRALVTKPPQTTGRIPPAGREIHHPVRTHFDVGDIEGLAVHEFRAIGPCGIRGATRRQRRVEQASARPVGLEQVVEKFTRVGVTRIELDTDGRSAADVARRRQGVDVVRGVLAGAVSISVVPVQDLMRRANFTVPRHIDVPLHVAVEEERLAGQVVAEVVGVAITAGEHVELLRLRAPVEDRAVRSLAGADAEVGEVGQKLSVLVLQHR